MEVVKINNGQITLPKNIRRQLNLNDNGKVAFVEKDGQYILVNPGIIAFEYAQKAFEGEAERLGLNDVDDVVQMIKELRAEWRKEKNNADNA